MQYPYPTMRVRALIKGGFHSEGELDRIFATPGQTIIRKQDPAKRNSPLLADTEKLGKYIEKQCKLSNAH